MEDLVKAVVSSLRYESYDRIKEQLDFTVIFALYSHFCFPSNSMASFPRVYHGPVASPAILGAM